MVYDIKFSIILNGNSIIHVQFTDEQLSLMLGGEMSMWTDAYCRSRECLDTGGTLPVAYWMYDKKYNNVFMQSIGGMVIVYSQLIHYNI